MAQYGAKMQKKVAKMADKKVEKESLTVEIGRASCRERV